LRDIMHVSLGMGYLGIHWDGATEITFADGDTYTFICVCPRSRCPHLYLAHSHLVMIWLAHNVPLSRYTQVDTTKKAFKPVRIAGSLSK
jgi:hypothetical protein